MSPFRLDPNTRLVGEGVLVGGSPFRVVQLRVDQLAALAARLHGRSTPGDHHFVRWLLDGGFLHPEPANPTNRSDVDVVIPFHNNHAELARLLDLLPVDRFASVTVVDDGSSPAVATRPNVNMVRHHHRRGPAAARNTGWRQGQAPLVLFVDADVTIDDPSWLDPMLALLPTYSAATNQADPPVDVVAVGPRVVPDSGPRSDLVARYEAARPSADLGAEAAPVRPRSRVPYVPTAALLARRAALESIDGFDESMPRGEDVDLVWRLAAHAGPVYYQPAAVVGHPARPTVRAWLRQRLTYGRGNGALAARHPDAVTALELSPWTLAAWTLASGSPAGLVAGVGLTAVSIPLLARRLPPSLPERERLAARLAGGGTLRAGPPLAGAIRRSWLPVVVVAAAVSRRWRRILVVAAAVPVLEWLRERPALDPVSWWAMRLADDAAYAVGQWWGALETGTGRALTIRCQQLSDLVTPTADVPPVNPAPKNTTG